MASYNDAFTEAEAKDAITDLKKESALLKTLKAMLMNQLGHLQMEEILLNQQLKNWSEQPKAAAQSSLLEDLIKAKIAAASHCGEPALMPSSVLPLASSVPGNDNIVHQTPSSMNDMMDLPENDSLELPAVPLLPPDIASIGNSSTSTPVASWTTSSTSSSSLRPLTHTVPACDSCTSSLAHTSSRPSSTNAESAAILAIPDVVATPVVVTAVTDFDENGSNDGAPPIASTTVVSGISCANGSGRDEYEDDAKEEVIVASVIVGGES